MAIRIKYQNMYQAPGSVPGKQSKNSSHRFFLLTEKHNQAGKQRHQQLAYYICNTAVLPEKKKRPERIRVKIQN